MIVDLKGKWRVTQGRSRVKGVTFWNCLKAAREGERGCTSWGELGGNVKGHIVQERNFLLGGKESQQRELECIPRWGIGTHSNVEDCIYCCSFCSYRWKPYNRDCWPYNKGKGTEIEGCFITWLDRISRCFCWVKIVLQGTWLCYNFLAWFSRQFWCCSWLYWAVQPWHNFQDIILFWLSRRVSCWKKDKYCI